MVSDEEDISDFMSNGVFVNGISRGSFSAMKGKRLLVVIVMVFVVVFENKDFVVVNNDNLDSNGVLCDNDDVLLNVFENVVEVMIYNNVKEIEIFSILVLVKDEVFDVLLFGEDKYFVGIDG